MTTTMTRIEDLLPWGPAKRVETRNGPRNLRTARPTEAFWTAWKQQKDMLKAAGVSCGKNDRTGDWEACWWQPLGTTEQQQVSQAQAASRATDADVDLRVPNGLSYLPFQRAGIAYAMTRNAVLFGDEMGLGKTIQAVGVWNQDPTLGKAVVVCPASLRLNWKREFEKWSCRPVRVAVVNGGRPGDWPTQGWDVLVINYDVLPKHRAKLDAEQVDLLVVDEAHYLKNPKAQRTKAVLGATTKGKRTAEGVKARRKLFLTGTPIVNRPVELWPLVEALDPADLGRSFFGFAKRYCNATQTKWGWDFSGACRLDELQRKLREKFLVRRLKADVLTELPAKRRQVIEIPANGASGAVAEERRVYDEHRAYIEELEQRLHEAETAAAYELDAAHDFFGDDIEALRGQLGRAKSTAFTEMSKVRHQVALAKVPHVVEHLKDALEEGPVVCFAHHKDVVAAIAAEFPGCVTLTGETSMEDRQAAVDSFQAGTASLFIGNIQAAGVGITLTKSSHVVFAELDWVPGNLSQAEDRCHRIGQTASVLVQHLVLEDSLDAEMARKLVKKQEVIDKALDTKHEVSWGQAGATEIPVDRTEVERAVAAMAAITTPQHDAVLLALRTLAGMCDGARSLDGCGFNRFDTNIGKQLARQTTLSPKQVLLGIRLANKYRGQLSPELVAACKGGN